MNYLTINGIDFELHTSKKPIYPVVCDIPTYSRIYAFYEKPSQYKVDIWRDWCDWSYDTDGIRKFDITSANCMHFTISGLYTDGKVFYNLHITKAHKTAYKVTHFKY